MKCRSALNFQASLLSLKSDLREIEMVLIKFSNIDPLSLKSDLREIEINLKEFFNFIRAPLKSDLREIEIKADRANITGNKFVKIRS